MSNIANEHFSEQSEAMLRDHFELKTWHMVCVGCALGIGALGFGLSIARHLPIAVIVFFGLLSAAGLSGATLSAAICFSGYTVVRNVRSGYDGYLAASQQTESDQVAPFVPKRKLLIRFLQWFALASVLLAISGYLMHRFPPH